MAEPRTRIAAGKTVLEMEGGTMAELSFGGKRLELPPHYPLFEIDDAPADVVSSLPGDGSIVLEIATAKHRGSVAMAGGEEIRLRLAPSAPASTAAPAAPREVGLALAFPLSARFHLPEGHNIGRLIDRDMPVGEWYAAGSYPYSRYAYLERNLELYKNGLSYAFCLVELDGAWVRLMIRENVLKPDIHISRHHDRFVATFRWPAESEACLSIFGSMDEAVADFRRWMEREIGVRPLAARSGVPGWIRKVPLVFTVDLLRGNWEITHDFGDVTALVGELAAIGCPRETLFYLPGWNGAYDSTYPTYEPHPDLGGAEKFREMIEAMHRHGFRAMIHTNGWGLDPCHPDIETLLRFARPDDAGSYQGWQCSIPALLAKRRILKFRTGRIAIAGPAKAREIGVESTAVPQGCEAFLTVGGVKSAQRVRLTVDRRSVQSPLGWFDANHAYAFPFPIMLRPGVNRMRMEVVGEGVADWSAAWYQVRYSFIPPTPYTSWTYPILQTDTTHPEWIEIFVSNVERAVREYGIDAVHIDATGYERHPQILNALAARLPGIAIAGEGYSNLESLGFWALSQGANQSMIGQLPELYGTREQAGLPDRARITELYGWLDKRSPAADWVGDYIRLYPHLCAADAFVPVGKVCNTFPARQAPRDPADLWPVLRDAKRLGYIPGLRVNYRAYGLDEQTKRAVREIAGR